MNISTMRVLDRWLGVPACAGLTAVRRVTGVFRGQPPSTTSRLVFVKLAEQGSTVLATSAFRRAVELVGRENVHFMCFEENRFILDAMRLIPRENVITIRTDSLPIFALDTLRALRELRRRGVDTAVDMEFFARSTACITFLTGARRRVGFQPSRGEGPYRGNLMTHRVRYNTHLHASQSFRMLVDALDTAGLDYPMFDRPAPAPDVMPPPFQSEPGDVETVRAIVAEAAGNDQPWPLLLLNPNCSDMIPLRAWPERHYVELARWLLDRDPSLWIGLTGGPGETEPVGALVEQIGKDRCFNLAGKTSLHQLLVLYELADVLVTNDSGPAHFASMTSIDVVTLFGPEHPRVFGSRSPRNQSIYAGLVCSPCVSALNNQETKCRDNRCMQRIDVETVERAVLRALERRASGEERRNVELEVLATTAVTGPAGR